MIDSYLVYTTTQRVLKDPTATRLENLFWRIWGSRKTKLGELSAQKIANVFANISNGTTAPGIGPLKSIANRDESGVSGVGIHFLFRVKEF